MDKAFEIQKHARENVKTLQNYLTDLQNWEVEMKRKEAALNGEFDQDLPPVRSKIKKDKPIQVIKKPEKRINSIDYKAWDNFDVDKACEEIETSDVGPVSLDGKMSQQAKQEKLREEAQYEKERGNTFVKQQKWDEAISCYNRAIELVKDDAIYYANRGLCYLMKESLHQAESDCTEALRLDPTYVKALQRRATAREKLGSLRSASQDLSEVLKLEPQNVASRNQLMAIRTRMGTKGSKSKSSPSMTPTLENKTITFASSQSQSSSENSNVVMTADEKWKNGVGEGITVIKPVRKPPHLRSKRALKSIPIQEIQLGKTSPDKPPTRLKIIEIEDDHSHGDTNNNDSNKINDSPEKVDAKGDTESPHSEKLISEGVGEKIQMVPPVNSVQFMSEWKYLKDKGSARSNYLSIIEPSRIPAIFENALESDVLSDVIRILHDDPNKFTSKSVAAYLKALCNVKRFSALAMFLSTDDKKLLNNLLEHCKTVENCSEKDIADLKDKYEL